MSIVKTVVVSTIVLVSTLSLHNSAQAGIFDWIIGSSATSVQSAATFDSLFQSILAPTITEKTIEPQMAITATSLISQAPHAVTTIRPLSPKTSRVYTVQVSGYNSEVAQTDDSPFITARGTHVRDGIVAANMFPFGTFIKFKDCGSVDEDKIFIVEDRMNRRYQNNVDIWFESKTDALELGRRNCEIEVIS